MREDVFKINSSIKVMDFDEELEESLLDRTREAIENDVMESEGPGLKHKSNEQEEKIERQAFSKTGASISPQQMEYLVSQKTDMDNEELEKFLAGEDEASRLLGDWNNFSRTEEKFMIQSFQSMGPEEIAQKLDRSEKEVEVKLKMMGLNPEEM